MPKDSRLGLLLAHEGNWRGRQLIPAAWIADATTKHAGQAHLWPGIATAFFGYGYQTWIFPGERGMFALLGVRGQAIYVDPKSILYLHGMTLDYKESLMQSGFVFENPNAKKSCGCGTSFSA